MELLDIVDTEDQVIGRASRREIHRRRLIHRATHMLLFNGRGELFVQRRSLAKDNDPGMWDSSAAGHVDAGESYLDCAIRELAEELGVSLPASAFKACFKMSPKPETGMEFAQIYRVVSDQPLVLDAAEVIDGRWVSPTHMDQWLVDDHQAPLSRALKLIWARYRQDTEQE